MMTVKENLREVMKKDGNPERFVKQYEFLHILVPDTYYMGNYPIFPGAPDGVDQFGVTWCLPVGQLGAFPRHDEEHRVLKDITKWRELLHKPYIPEDPGYWGMLNGIAAQADRENQYIAGFHAQGVFERLHALMGMEDTFANFYEEPEEMHALIDFITECELDFAKTMIERCHIEAIFHHDDWGATENSFLSPEMFEEFLLPAYKKIYGFYKEHGILIVHHNDGYARNLVPYMVEMGIDIWQGVIPANDIPSLVEEFGGKITFMGEIETRLLDVPGWTPEMVKAEVERACRKCGKHSFIPSLTAGMPMTNFVSSELVNAEIDRMSKEMF